MDSLVEGAVFDIRVVTPAVTNADGWPHAAGLLRIGGASLPFLLDLTSWGIGDYEQQWRTAIGRLARGAPVTALLTGYSNDAMRPHRMWALWRDGEYVYVQQHVVVPEDLDTPFDPLNPESHVGARLHSEHGVPIDEWRAELVHLIADSFGLRLPFRRP